MELVGRNSGHSAADTAYQMAAVSWGNLWLSNVDLSETKVFQSLSLSLFQVTFQTRFFCAKNFNSVSLDLGLLYVIRIDLKMKLKIIFVGECL